MKKRMSALFLAFILLLSFPSTAFACDKEQTNTYTVQILFGDGAGNKEPDKNVKMLLDALYICSEQSNNLGETELDYLKKQRVFGVPSLSKVNVKKDVLLECSHGTWEYESSSAKKAQKYRKELLQNTTNKVFDFGLINNVFGSKGGKCNSFAALLYYSHILSDYLADDPDNTDANVKGKEVSSYAGQPYVTINGNRPSFTKSQKNSTESFAIYSSLDSYGRAGVAIANIGTDIMPPSDSRQQIGMIKPSGWNQHEYPGIVNSQPPYLFNRCHLIGHQLADEDGEINLITGTRYLNVEGMLPFEEMVADYVSETGNHVLYRATPIYDGDALVASGVQLEGYSIEDDGDGICFNVYCYNVQPGVDINYQNGKSELSDVTIGSDDVIPFATYNASENTPDLIYEVNRHLDIIFEDQKKSATYTSLKNEITTIANEARMVGYSNDNSARNYIELKQYEYKYFEILKSYVPILLDKEEFFTSAFS